MASRAGSLILLACLLLAGCTSTPPPQDDELPLTGETEDLEQITAVATGLDTVWAISFAPDGRLFFTERRGTVMVLDSIQDTTPETVRTLDVVERGESGLMGMALDPAFPERSWLYACHTYRAEDGELRNRVVRFDPTQGQDGDVQVLLDGIDASQIHDGCRVAFGPDAHLYMTMGDAAQASRAQDAEALNGKVLRMTRDGDPAGAPEVHGGSPYVYTLGHRNPQGLAFHPGTGTAVISEHGPENHDEVNVLEAGGNYGWPKVRGKDDGGGRFTPSVWTSGSGGTVAPAGAAFLQAEGSPLDGAFAFATLKAAQLHLLELAEDDPTQVEDEHIVFEERFGRLRAVTWGPDDALYLGTSNADGRGNPGPQDDRILRVPLSVLEG